MLEDYFMSQNVGKAIQHSSSRLDEGDADMGGDPGSSLLLDDVFFLLKKCVQRAIGGQNVDGVCAVVNNACRILEQDFCGTLQSQVRIQYVLKFVPNGTLENKISLYRNYSSRWDSPRVTWT